MGGPVSEYLELDVTIVDLRARHSHLIPPSTSIRPPLEPSRREALYTIVHGRLVLPSVVGAVHRAHRLRLQCDPKVLPVTLRAVDAPRDGHLVDRIRRRVDAYAHELLPSCGVRTLFRRELQAGAADVTGVEELGQRLRFLRHRADRSLRRTRLPCGAGDATCTSTWLPRAERGPGSHACRRGRGLEPPGSTVGEAGVPAAACRHAIELLISLHCVACAELELSDRRLLQRSSVPIVPVVEPDETVEKYTDGKERQGHDASTVALPVIADGRARDDGDIRESHHAALRPE